MQNDVSWLIYTDVWFDGICRSDPDYYTVVKRPIDLLKIGHKLKSDEYEDIDQLTADIELLVNNAKAYYQVSYCSF